MSSKIEVLMLIWYNCENMNVTDNKQLKVSSFYGNQVARPFLILENGLKVESRVDAPSVNESIIRKLLS
jgi:hypothetical protein